MKNLFTLLVNLIIFTPLVFSQNIGIDTTKQNLINLPDTIFINDNYAHTVNVTNYSNTPLTGNIYLMGGIDSSGTFLSVDTLGTKPVTAFGLNDTLSFTYNEIYNFTNSYKLGGNIVVVWPVADFGTTNDTLSKPVFIRAAASINKLDKSAIYIYPNPFNDKITIKPTNKNSIKHVRIFDVNGKIIFNDAYSQTINLAKERKGLYFVEILFYDNKRLHYKVIKH